MGDRQPMIDRQGGRPGGSAAAVRRRAPAGRKHRDFFSLKARSRWLVLFAALFAFSWQSVVTATHHHPGTGFAARVDAGKPAPVVQSGKSGAPEDSPANCPICRELAHTAHYLPPAPIVFAAPLSATAQRVTVAALSLAPGQRWHGWRSRAPPSLLRT